jgi:hypothetical protein
LETIEGSTGARGQAMRASSATSPCLWERGGCCYCCYHYCMAVAFPRRMRRPSSCPPRNGSLSSAAVSVRSNARPLRVLLLPPYPTPAPSPCPRAALLAAAERRKGTTYGFITDGRQRWRHARARCSLACPLSDVRISIPPPIISYPEVISHTRPALACLPITNHCCRGQVREGFPLLCVLCSWRLLGVSVSPLILLSPACSIYSAPARDHQQCSAVECHHRPACICSSIAHHRDYRYRRCLFSRSPDRPACARPVGEDVQIRCSPRPITNAVGSSMQIV